MRDVVELGAGAVRREKESGKYGAAAAVTGIPRGRDGGVPVSELPRIQRKILGFIALHYRLNGFAPTVREIAQAVDRSASLAQGHLRQLVAGGYIGIEPGRPRTIRIEETG